MREDVEILDDIVDDMLDMAKEYELEGVELTNEDALWVLDRMKTGVSREDAMRERMSDIRDVLDEGLAEAEAAGDYDDSFFGDPNDDDI